LTMGGSQHDTVYYKKFILYIKKL